MNYILRDIKLSKLTNIPPVGDAAKLVKFWDELWTDMKVYIDKKKGEIKCWKDGYDYYYFIQNDKNDRLWCNFEQVIFSFIYYLGLTYPVYEELIHHMVDDILNCEVNPPNYGPYGTKVRVDDILNCKINSPIYFRRPLEFKVWRT